MSTEVFVNVNGMVQHRHPGAKGWGKKNWHDPAKAHPELHRAEKAATPTNLKDLTEAQVAQYKAALAGESFYANNLKFSAQRRGLPEGELHVQRQKAEEEAKAAVAAAEAALIEQGMEVPA